MTKQRSYVPHVERTGSLRAVAVSLQAGALLDHLAATSDEDLRRIAKELDDGAKCLRAILRQRARAKQQAAKQQAAKRYSPVPEAATEAISVVSAASGAAE